MTTSFRLRRVLPDEMIQLCVPMRRAILVEELHWIDSSTSNLVDAWDRVSIHLGLFSDDRLVGAGRLVIRDDLISLPSGSYIPTNSFSAGRVGELSRVMICKDWRGKGGFRAICLGLVLEAALNQLSGIVATIIDDDRHARFLAKIGFHCIRKQYSYSDGVISPSGYVSTLILNNANISWPVEEMTACWSAALGNMSYR